MPYDFEVIKRAERAFELMRDDLQRMGRASHGDVDRILAKAALAHDNNTLPPAGGTFLGVNKHGRDCYELTFHGKTICYYVVTPDRLKIYRAT